MTEQEKVRLDRIAARVYRLDLISRFNFSPLDEGTPWDALPEPTRQTYRDQVEQVWYSTDAIDRELEKDALRKSQQREA